MIFKRPYLLRAWYDWITDSQYTPYVLVEVDGEDVRVPAEHVKEGRIVLNISPSAVRQLAIEDSAVQFESRFGGVAYPVYLPMRAIRAIYARETSEGMMFEDEAFPSPAADAGAAEDDTTPKTGKPSLKVVK